MLELSNVYELIYNYGYIGIFFVIFLESGFFPPLPGDSLLFTAGLFASKSGINIVLLLISISLATFLGSLLAYEIGKNLLKLQQYSFWRKLFKQENIEKAHKFFNNYGKFAITFARFIPFMRTLIPIVAGVASMNYQSFVRYTAIGAVLWSSVVTLAGYFLGQTFPILQDYLWLIVLLFVLVAVIPLIAEFLRRSFKK